VPSGAEQQPAAAGRQQQAAAGRSAELARSGALKGELQVGARHTLDLPVAVAAGETSRWRGCHQVPISTERAQRYIRS
jgi:hypothetical protein